MVLQLQDASCVALRCVATGASILRGPVWQVAAWEDPSLFTPCMFLAWDASGCCFAWQLDFSSGPFERPSVRIRRLEPQPGVPGATEQWVLGRFWPAGTEGSLGLCILGSSGKMAVHTHTWTEAASNKPFLAATTNAAYPRCDTSWSGDRHCCCIVIWIVRTVLRTVTALSQRVLPATGATGVCNQS